MVERMRGGPLEGVRVIELTKVWAGPYVGKLLAFLGAEVIKIESAGSLDVTRTYGVADPDLAAGFCSVNPQKLSVQINTKSKAGIALLLKLLKTADIFIENLRPGAIDRMGLGYQIVKAEKPDIIYVSMGMFGNEGPLAYQTGYAPSFAAISGISLLVGYEGEKPTGMNVRFGDSTVGTAAAYAAAVALAHRKLTGEGQFIDVSAVESMSSMISDTIMDYTLNGVLRAADGNRHQDMTPHGVYPAANDEWITIAVSGDQAWRELASVMGVNDTRFATLAGRKANEADLDRLVAAWTASRDARGTAAELQARGIAAAISENSIDLIADAHLWGRDFYPTITDDKGRRPIVGPSWKMTRAASISDGAPRLGEHNAYVFGEILGLSAEEQAQLAESGVAR